MKLRFILILISVGTFTNIFATRIDSDVTPPNGSGQCFKLGGLSSYGYATYDHGKCPAGTVHYRYSYPDVYIVEDANGGTDGLYCSAMQVRGITNTLGTCHASASYLSNYDKDPSGCQKNGGTMIGVGTKVVGATGYGASFFGGQGIMLGGDIEQVTKCVTTSEALGTVAQQILGLIPMASSLFKSGLLKYFANKAVKPKFKSEVQLFENLLK